MIKETMSNWQCVVEKMKQQPRVYCGQYMSQLFKNDPEKLLGLLSYYKFATKLIGKNKRILEVGCKEGFGSQVLAKECGFVCATETDPIALEIARMNFGHPQIQFSNSNFIESSFSGFDALVSFASLEDSMVQNLSSFIEKVCDSLIPNGMAVLGAPRSLGFGNAFEKAMRDHFQYVLLFSAIHEVVQVGSEDWAEAPYHIIVGCKNKS